MNQATFLKLLKTLHDKKAIVFDDDDRDDDDDDDDDDEGKDSEEEATTTTSSGKKPDLPPGCDRCPGNVNERFQQAADELHQFVLAAGKNVSTSRPFHRGLTKLLPLLRPKELTAAAFPSSNPVEWKDAEFAQVEKLCVQAPYGKDTETVVDTKVRNALEMTADKFVVENQADWSSQLVRILFEVSKQLAPSVRPMDLELVPYKLVIYEKGGHFKPHRDTQRSDLHFGTVVVILPAVGKVVGGDLILRHGSLQETITVPGGKKKCAYVGYFADVEHEVTPVVKGRRISLLYHLCRRESAKHVSVAAPTPLEAMPAMAETKPFVLTLKSLGPTLVDAIASVAAAGGASKDSSSSSSSDDSDSSSDKGDSGSSNTKKDKENDSSVAPNENTEPSQKKAKMEKKEEPPKIPDDTEWIPRFAGYICEHSYAGNLTSDKLKGLDQVIYGQLAREFPAIRIVPIDIRAHGSGWGDEGSYIRSPKDLGEYCIEVDEVSTTALPAPVDRDAYHGGFGQLSFSKPRRPTRPLLSAPFESDWMELDEVKNYHMVRFLNKRQELSKVINSLKAAERRVCGSGNEGAAGAFLYNNVAMLVPLVPNAESVLDDFSMEHTLRDLPEYLP